MKFLKIVLFGTLLITANNLHAQSNYTLSGFTVTINGTSNLHNWNETVGKVSGKGNIEWNAGKAFTIRSFNIVMQVNSIKSDAGSTMNNKTYKALKDDKFPEITFSLTEPIAAVVLGVKEYSLMAKGTLTIAGVTRSITIPIKISEDAKKITIDGVGQVKMTDYGIDPPTALFGVLKTGDGITISFKTTFSLMN